MNTMICIVCPVGCRLQVALENGKYVITGNQCKRGEIYAMDELIHPTRMVTTTIKINGSYPPRLPVKTERPIPKQKIAELIHVLKRTEVNPPVRRGQVIIKDALQMGIDVIATKTVDNNNL